MNNDDLMAIVRNTVKKIDGPVYVEDNCYRGPRSFDLFNAIMASPPAYHVLVAVNGLALGDGPWVAVTYTERFGFTPMGPMEEVYTYLSPPEGVDRDDRESVSRWLESVLPDAVTHRIPLALAARENDKDTPVEARDAIIPL